MNMHDDMIHDIDMMQLSDSMFPSGLFATSNGLESFHLEKKIEAADQLERLCAMYIEQQVGPCDCVIAGSVIDLAKNDYAGLLDADAACLAIKTNRETREAAIRSGVQLGACVEGFCNDDTLARYNADVRRGRASGIYPVSHGLCCAALNIPKKRAQMMLCYGFVASSVGAALRLGIIQHLEGQNVIHRLKPVMLDAVARYGAIPLDEAWQFAPEAEINQARHETMDSKMFAT